MTGKPRVLFVCTHNAGRSQIAAAWLHHLAGDSVDVRSAGLEPATQVSPVAVEAMREVGIDITARTPHELDQRTVEASNVLVTMNCGDLCPVLPGQLHLAWDFEDPSGHGIETVRQLRDAVKARVEQLLADLRDASD